MAAVGWTCVRGCLGIFVSGCHDRLLAWGVVAIAWDASTSVHLYSGHDLADVVKRQLLAALAITPAHGLVWHDTALPVFQLELEIDVRRYLREVTLWPRA